jgi:hypothetical protein
VSDDDREYIPLTDEEKLQIVPEMAHRASVLFKLYRLDMIREPHNNQELAVWRHVQDMFATGDEGAE